MTVRDSHVEEVEWVGRVGVVHGGVGVDRAVAGGAHPSSTWRGLRVYDWALLDSADPDHQYMIRRSIDDGELAFYHCYNPNHARFGELVHVAGARWPIEECFGSAKNEVGLDNYQVRTWEPWHRHITLAMLAHTFLAVTAHKAKKRGPNSKHSVIP